MSAPRRFFLSSAGLPITVLTGIVWTALSQLALAYASLFIHNLYPVWSSPLWPASGAALAAVLLGGPWMLVGVYLGLLPPQFFFWGSVPTATALLLPLANTTETLVGWLLLRKVVQNFRDWLPTQRDIVIFLITAPWIPALTSAFLAQLLLRLNQAVTAHSFINEFIIYAFGNASGIILLTPLILVWRDLFSFSWMSTNGLRIVAHTGAVALTIWMIHAHFFYSGALLILLVPILIWGVWSTGLKGATLSCLLLSFLFFSFKANQPFDLRLMAKHSDTTMLAAAEQSQPRKEFFGPSVWLMQEPLTAQLSMLTVFCLTMLPLGLAADTLRTNTRKDQLFTDSNLASLWSWNHVTGYKLDPSALAWDLPKEVDLFSKKKTTGQIQIASPHLGQPSYVSHWLITRLSSSGEPLEATGLLQCLKLQEQANKAMKFAEIANMEIATLRARLNPHLLFNCLTGLRALIRRNPTKAREFTGQLARFLRSAVDSQSKTLITLQEEVSLCRDFVSLEEMRGEGIEVKWTIPQDTKNFPLPPTTLQTLIENGLKHGERQDDRNLILHVSALRTPSNKLTIRVSQPGTYAPSPSFNKGAGIQLIRQHLALVYHEEASLEIGEESPGVVTARLHLPAQAI